MTYLAVEFNATTLEMTGRFERFRATTLQEAINDCLESRRTTNGAAYDQEQIVYSGRYGHVLTLSSR